MKGQGCPIHKYQKSSKSLNDYFIKKLGSLQKTNPILVKEWNFKKNVDLKPSDITEGSKRKVWWVCPKGHEYKSVIYDKSKGIECPICLGRKIQIGFNDLATVNPRLTTEWNYKKNSNLRPEMVTHSNNTKVWWICKNGHEWKATVGNRSYGTNCPICQQGLNVSLPEKMIYFYIKRILKDSLENYKPIWIGRSELDIFIPSLKQGIEYDGQYWHKETERDKVKNQKCLRNNVKLIRIREPECQKLNDTSVDYYVKSRKLVDIISAVQFIIDYINRTNKTSFKLKFDLEEDLKNIYKFLEFTKEENSLLKINPELAKDWNYNRNGNLSPDNITYNSNKKVWWICKNGHEWLTTVESRNRDKHGCPFCTNRKVLKGFNDFSTTHPELYREWNFIKNKDLDPNGLTYGSHKKVWWICKNKHEWIATLKDRTRGTNCPYCYGINK